jgi:hypothetical protein
MKKEIERRGNAGRYAFGFTTWGLSFTNTPPHGVGLGTVMFGESVAKKLGWMRG